MRRPDRGRGRRSGPGRSRRCRHSGGAPRARAVVRHARRRRDAGEPRGNRHRPHPANFPAGQSGLLNAVGRRRHPGQGQGRRRAPARLPRRHADDMHRRMAARGLGLLAPKVRGGKARALPLLAGDLEDAGGAGRASVRLCRGLRRCRNPQGQSVVRPGAAGRADRPRAPGQSAISRGQRHHPLQHQRLPRGHQDRRPGVVGHGRQAAAPARRLSSGSRTTPSRSPIRASGTPRAPRCSTSC